MKSTSAKKQMDKITNYLTREKFFIEPGDISDWVIAILKKYEKVDFELLKIEHFIRHKLGVSKKEELTSDYVIKQLKKLDKIKKNKKKI